ncbi:dihydrodipicolinate synthase family protein [Motiliproteus sp. MSK22-1]|uniref:dihydrodipicolinate synthase family protein n=1 Tax=Motiliproteus sp. MSK22-1 TaxID=1897630 RepID=UPI00097547EB|nr:dihydrodipicolinate synthase family protein [Motiliproteus sp. MSK22-1]OMH29444.1 dihydrodipicolinate synthase family protein [Motiliproteus sp. MSK22-1]
MHILLPNTKNKLERYNFKSSGYGNYVPKLPFNRAVYAAAHVVVDPLAERHPWGGASAIDWDATLGYREHLWRMGFKVAEAMDTSQRGMGVDWPTSLELVKRSLELAKGIEGADLASGAGTDQLVDFAGITLDDVKRAYIEQIDAIEGAGGRIILMASRALAHVAKCSDDYIVLYNELIQGCRYPVILHWLGSMFDPMLSGYWGSDDVSKNMDTVMTIIKENEDKIDGIKLSLLEKEYEFELRRRLPVNVKMFTGDDFNYPELVEGDGEHFSHGLLGIFDPIAPVAARALEQLAQGDAGQYRALMEPTIALSRKIFESPTQYYKAGVVFIAWLNGHQEHFIMAGGMQSARSISHYSEVFRLADRAGVLKNPELAVNRMQQLLALHGVR